MRVRIWAGAIVLGTLVALAGCGQNGDETNEAAEPTASEPSPARLTLLEAERTVENYYGAIDNLHFATAWSALGRGPRVEFEGFANWKAGHTNTLETNLEEAKATRLSATSASVRVRLSTVDVDECGNDVAQSFAGTWTVELVNGLATLTDPDIERVSGEEPLEESECLPPPTTTTAPPPPSDCHPSYEGACLDPASIDYDCAGGSGNGPDYVEGPLTVVGPDEYGLDGNSDGTACEF